MKAIAVNTPLFKGNEKKYLLECIETGWVSSEGPFISRFETEFSNYIGRDFGIAVSNGSAALDIALKAIGISEGDEVIMPAFTIISPAYSIVRQGGIPVLVDSNPSTWNMDVNKIEEKITKKTKAILVVHIYGLPCDMAPILAIAKKHDLKVIEDAAEMHGQTYNNQLCGSFGDISIFSFYPNKHITTGEGGMVLTDNPQLAEKCSELRNLSFIKNKRRFVHEDIGWNYRMTNMQAALGVAQLERINDIIKRKREIGNLYNNLLKDINSQFTLPLMTTDYAENIYWVYALTAPSEDKMLEVTEYLNSKKIGTRPFFWCMHEQPVFLKMGLFQNESYPVAEKLARNGFYIPSGLGLTDNEIKIVAKELLKIANG